MEFEKNISADEQARLLASAKKVTLQPISTAVLPEPAEGADLNTKLSETAHQSNVLNDSEDTGVQLERARKHAQSLDSSSSPQKRMLVVSTALICLSAAAFIWMTTK